MAIALKQKRYFYFDFMSIIILNYYFLSYFKPYRIIGYFWKFVNNSDRFLLFQSRFFDFLNTRYLPIIKAISIKRILMHTLINIQNWKLPHLQLRETKNCHTRIFLRIITEIKGNKKHFMSIFQWQNHLIYFRLSKNCTRQSFSTNWSPSNTFLGTTSSSFDFSTINF